MILRKVSEDGVKSSRSFLFVFTDGDLAQISSYSDVQLPYLVMFAALELDFLVTARTA